MIQQSTKDMMLTLKNTFDMLNKQSNYMTPDELRTSIEALRNLYYMVYEDYMFADVVDDMARLHDERIEAEEVARTESALWFEQGEKCYEIDQ
jgi:hypothetical protein